MRRSSLAAAADAAGAIAARRVCHEGGQLRRKERYLRPLCRRYYIVLLSLLDCIEAICAFAKLGVAALLPLPMPLTLRHSSSAWRGGAASKGESCGESIAAIRWAATNATAPS